MPQIAAAPCHRVFVEFDTSILAAVHLLRAVGSINLIDLVQNPRLRVELGQRCRAALARESMIGDVVMSPNGTPKRDRGGDLVRRHGPVPFEWVEEPVDRWQTFSVLAEQFPRQTIYADCDCLAPLWAAYWELRFRATGLPGRAGVGVSQPKKGKCRTNPKKLCGRGMAHAFTVLDIPEETREGLSDALNTGLDGALVRPIHPEWNNILVFDGSVLAGMPAPADPGFYGGGESAALWLNEGR